MRGSSSRSRKKRHKKRAQEKATKQVISTKCPRCDPPDDKSKGRRNTKEPEAETKTSIAPVKCEKCDYCPKCRRCRICDKAGYDGNPPHIVEMDFIEYIDGKPDKIRVSRNVNESPAYRLYYRKIIDRHQFAAAEKIRFWGEVIAVSPLKAKQLVKDRIGGGNGKPVDMTEMQAEAHQALGFIFWGLKDGKNRSLNYQILFEFCVGGLGIEDLAKRHWGSSDYRRKLMSKRVQDLLTEVVDLLEECT